MNKEAIKKIIVILVLVLICLIAWIILYVREKADSNEESNENNISNSINNATTNNINENEFNTTIIEAEPVDSWIKDETKGKEKLEEVSDLYSYFLMKQCISNYYNPEVGELALNMTSIEEQEQAKKMMTAETQIQALNMIDIEAQNKLNINQDNVLNLYNDFGYPEFNIDKIYKQKLDENKDVYVVYHRLQKNTQSNSSTINTVLSVKIDKKNIAFSIYPYEYLRATNCLELGEGDVITLNNLNEIEQNDANIYGSNIDLEDDQLCITEFYNRYRFDVKYDVKGLYDKINEEYKSLKFPNFNDFQQYINENRENILKTGIAKYEVNKYDDYRDYIVIDKNGMPYIFSAKSIMDYTILLDKYTVLTKKYAEQYENALTGAQTKYCINRIIQAINDKNYEFVYQKLNTIQKNNYYRNIEDFKEFIINNFYEKNNFEVDEDYLEVGSKVNQYNVKITDATESEFTYRKFTMTVTIKDDTDFEISITN